MHTHASCRQCFECFKPIVDFEVTFHNFHLCLSAYHHSSRIMHSLGKSGLKCSESTASVHGRLKRFFRLFHGQNLRLPSEVSVQVHATIELRNWVPEGSDLGSTPDGWTTIGLSVSYLFGIWPQLLCKVDKFDTCLVNQFQTICLDIACGYVLFHLHSSMWKVPRFTHTQTHTPCWFTSSWGCQTRSWPQWITFD
jgi:hypothetical protein